MSFIFSDVKLAYLLTVGLCGPVVIWLLVRWIKIIERRKRRRIKSLKRFEALKTTTPLEQPLSESKEAALDNVEGSFSIIKKAFIIFVAIIWLIALCFPFLNQIPATFVSVFIAAFGVIIGIAARPFIENIISGIVLSFSRSIRIGDTVIVDKYYGTVEDLTITHTVIKVWNWRRYLVPNSKMLTKDFVNCTLSDNYQWAHVEFWVSYDADIIKVEQAAIDAAKSSKYFAGHEPPRFWVLETDKNSVKCWIAAWADSAVAAWQLKHETRTELIKRLQALGIKTQKFVLDTDAFKLKD